MTAHAQSDTLAAELALEGAPVAEATTARSTAADATDAVVERARRGDPNAFDALAAARIDRSYRLAVAILGSEADARDAVQEAYVSAWRELPRLRDAGRFDAWLDRIVVNACRMALRHRGVVRVREIEVFDVDDHHLVAPGLAAAAADEGLADVLAVRQAMRRLSGDQRALLVLHHVEGRPVAEIATVMGIPTGTVKWRLHGARAALQHALEEDAR